MASSMLSSVKPVTRASAAQASMMAPFTGLKSAAFFPVTCKLDADITSVASNGGRVQCMEIEKVAEKPVETLVEKPRLVFIWMEKNIGLALDQTIPGHGPTPLSPYYFWPRKDAWEELKTTLENKPWVSQKKMIILLNQATDIINLWQQSGGNLSG